MGLFGKKKNAINYEMAPLGYWEEESYMIAIPKELSRDVLAKAVERMSAIDGVIVKEFGQKTKEEPFRFCISYKGEDYTGGMYVGNFTLPQMPGRQDFYFTKEEWEEMSGAQFSLTVFMKFNKDAKKSFHLQLKLMYALVPNLIGVMDESAERMLCSRWIKMAVESNVTPGPDDMYIVHAISDDSGEVWLHTHGLLRSGISELEIVASDKEHFESHYNILNSMARILLDKKDEFVPRQSSKMVGVLRGQIPVVATYIPWTEGMKEYPNLKVGGPDDRKEGHNSLTSFIFLYRSESDETAQKLSKVSIYNDILEDNPIFFFSNEETDRLRMMARERFFVVQKAAQEGHTVLLKIGLPVDEGAEGECEHIWFELDSVNGDSFVATLTQDPYNVSGIKKGDKRELTVNDVTDWMIYTSQFAVTPDKSYLLF